MTEFYSTKSSKIGELIKFTRENEGEYQEINFSTIPNFLAQQINQQTTVRTNGALKILSTHAIAHIFKQHGAGTGQEARGQKTITDADLELIPQIFSSPDTIEKGNQNSKGKQCVLFKKKINGCTYHLVAAVHNKKDRETGKEEVKLFVNTLYAKK